VSGEAASAVASNSVLAKRGRIEMFIMMILTTDTHIPYSG
jgi:hypothetical protein